jgi:gamma-glutamylcyclotransferase (GGCT)/AIG2-like uncharacterized protein YtfP
MHGSAAISTSARNLMLWSMPNKPKIRRCALNDKRKNYKVFLFYYKPLFRGLLSRLKPYALIMFNEFLFVYGTLRRPAGRHNLLLKHCRYYGSASLHGLLYEVNGYPGAIASAESGSCVVGELYRIIKGEPLFTLLDDYEECSDGFAKPHEYVRKKLRVTTAAGDTVLAWVYIYNLPVTGLRKILSGDYFCNNPE